MKRLFVSSFILGLLFFTTSSFRPMLWLPLTAQKEENLPNRPIYGVIDQTVFSDGSPKTLAPQFSQAPEITIPWCLVTFQSYRDGNWEIYLTDGSGVSQTRLTSNGASDINARLNRDVTHIVFSSNRTGKYKIFTMNLDGSGLTQITSISSNDINPFWSPDETQIVFETDRDIQAEIYKMNSDGTNPTRLTTSNDYDGMPAWSPDGTRIAFISHRTGGYRLYVMNTDGSSVIQLSNQAYTAYPSWSPDGSQIAYAADGNGDGWLELWLMNADGTNQRQIYKPFGQYVDVWPRSWTQDGRYIGTSTMYYVSYQNTWYWTDALAGLYDTIGNNEYGLTSGNMDQNPDIRTTDPVPPISKVDPLPAYSRANGFPVYWSGFDNISGITSFDLQYRIFTGTWQDWPVSFNPGWTSGFFNLGNPGDHVYFRIRSRDQAGNVETWHNEIGDTSTTLFKWLLEGKTIDNRGYPLSPVPIQLSPAGLNNVVTNFYGEYQAFLRDNGGYKVETALNGFGTLPTTTLGVISDRVKDFVLPPIDNQIKDGDFEASGLSSWRVSSSITPTLTRQASITGQFGLTLGQPSLDFTPPITITHSTYPKTIDSYDQPALAIDKTGMIHIAWVENGDYDIQHIVYTTCSQNGICQPSIRLSTGSQPILAVDSSNQVHLVWFDQNSIQYANRPSNGSWSSPETVGPANDYYPGCPAIVVDPADRLHVVWDDGRSISYRNRQGNGNWSAIVKLTDYGTRPAIVAAKNGDIHIVWGTGYATDDLAYRKRNADGSWGEVESIMSLYWTNTIPSLGIDSQGILFLVYDSIGQFFYRTRDPAGGWSAPTEITGMVADSQRVVVKPDGTVVLAWSGQFVSYMIPGGAFTPKAAAFGSYIATLNTALASDPQTGRMVMATTVPGVNIGSRYICDIVLTLFNIQEETSGESAISQTLLIPSDFHKATLGFSYRYGSNDMQGQDWFDVKVNNGIKETQLTQIDTPSGETYRWLDLQSWTGQTITLTFDMHSTANGKNSWVFLDDVSLGSWLTPVISEISPSALDRWSSQTITITGENFIDQPSVLLNTKSITNVHWFNEHTLTLTLPSDLIAGQYDIQVINPAGQKGILPKALKLGYFVYMPCINR